MANVQAGARTRMSAILHGVWLGHPLHPVLTDVSVGAWSLSSFFDILSLFERSQKSQNTADSLVELGNVAALPTVLAGLADFSTIPKGAAGVGLSHATLNAAGYTLYLASARSRSAIRSLRTTSSSSTSMGSSGSVVPMYRGMFRLKSFCSISSSSTTRQNRSSSSQASRTVAGSGACGPDGVPLDAFEAKEGSGRILRPAAWAPSCADRRQPTTRL